MPNLKVSIPIGFSSSLQPPRRSRAVSLMLSFNPYRVFKFVATVYSLSWNSIVKGFQSLSGFQVRCNASTSTITTLIDRFQSLSGFQVRCNAADRFASQIFGTGFQSLSGFQVRCNLTFTLGIIPIKLFQSLSGFQVRCNRSKAPV